MAGIRNQAELDHVFNGPSNQPLDSSSANQAGDNWDESDRDSGDELLLDEHRSESSSSSSSDDSNHSADENNADGGEEINQQQQEQQFIVDNNNQLNNGGNLNDVQQQIQQQQEQQLIVDNNNQLNNGGNLNDVQPQNPLADPEILRRIFSFLPTAELNKCRGANQQWNHVACDLIEEKVDITLIDNISIVKYMEAFDYTSTYETMDLRRPRHHGFKMYRVPLTRSNIPLKHFLISYGQNVHKLSLQQLEVPATELVRALLYMPELESLWTRPAPSTSIMSPVEGCEDILVSEVINPYVDIFFPNIKHFTIGTTSFERSPDSILHGIEWIVPEDIKNGLPNLWRCLPNLLSITMSELDHPIEEYMSSSILDGVLKLGPAGLPNLNALNFPLFVGNSTLEMLYGFHLSKFTQMDITFNEDVEVNTADTFLTRVAPKLEKFKLRFVDDFPNFPKIEIYESDFLKLRQFTLQGYLWHLDFLQYMVELESLTCIDMSIETVWLTRSRTPSLTMRELRIIRDVIDDWEILTKISNIFPRLVKLEVPGITDKGLRIIYSCLPNLTELACLYGRFTDYGITGIDLEVCRDIVELRRLRENPNGLRKGNLYIGCLKNLRNLRLESRKMTNVSIQFGIINCQLISHLTLNSDRLSDTGMKPICKVLHWSLLSLNVADCINVTGAFKTYALSWIPHLQVYVHGELVQTILDKIKAQHEYYQVISLEYQNVPERNPELRRRSICKAYRIAFGYDEPEVVVPAGGNVNVAADLDSINGSFDGLDGDGDLYLSDSSDQADDDEYDTEFFHEIGLDSSQEDVNDGNKNGAGVVPNNNSTSGGGVGFIRNFIRRSVLRIRAFFRRNN